MKAQLNATLIKDEQGEWTLRLESEESEGVEVLRQLLDDTGFYRDTMHTFILSMSSSTRGSEGISFECVVQEGPDVPGGAEALKPLRNWRPAEK